MAVVDGGGGGGIGIDGEIHAPAYPPRPYPLRRFADARSQKSACVSGSRPRPWGRRRWWGVVVAVLLPIGQPEAEREEEEGEEEGVL